MARELKVKIVGDASGLAKSFRQASDASRGFGSSLGKVAKYAALGVGAAGIGGLAVVLKTGIEEFTESSKVAAQTAAVLKSTGGAANVTAKQVDALSSALMRKSGVDDEQIKTGENMLLTFTKIRNEAGRGNDIFNQATRATLDLSVAMGKDMQSSAILVGKALNDPLKGISALSRAGVQLSADQVKMIEGFVKTGDVMSAQKVLLGELTTQFGGSAEALGNTVPGQINRLRESFSNLSGQIVTSLVPSFVKILDWTTAHWPQIEATVKAVFTALNATIGNFVRFIQTHWQTISSATTTAFNTIRNVAENVWPRVQAAAARVMAWYQGTLRPAIQNVIAALTAVWNRFGADITRIAQTAFNTARAVITAALRVIQGVVEGVLAVIRGDWTQAWNSLKQVVSNVFAGIRALIGGFARIAYTAMVAVGRALIDGILAGAAGIGERLGGFLRDKIQGAINSVKGAFGISSPSRVTAKEIGEPLAQGIVVGMDGGLAMLAPAAQKRIKEATDRIAAQLTAARSRFEGAFSGMTDKMFRAFDAETSGHRTAAEMELDTIAARRQAESLQNALQEALETGDGARIAKAQEDIRIAALEKQAREERKAYEDQRSTLRENLGARLSTISAHFQKEGVTVSAALAAITKLMGQYGVSFEEAGKYIGESFMFGLQKAVGGAAAAAGGVRGAQTGGNTRPMPPIVTQVVLDRKVIAEAVREENAIYQRANGTVFAV